LTCDITLGKAGDSVVLGQIEWFREDILGTLGLGMAVELDGPFARFILGVLDVGIAILYFISRDEDDGDQM